MKELTNTRNYTKKKVFIGIDVHKKTYSLVAICEERIVKKWSMTAIPSKCVEVLLKFFHGANINTVYESGFCGYGLHRELEKNNIKNIVVAPSSIQKSSNDRVKTDILDAKKLAFQLSKNLLNGIEIPTRERELKREITRLRSQLVDHRVSIILQIKSKLLYFGLMDPNDNRKVTDKYLKEIEGLNLPNEIRPSLSILIDQWRYLSTKIKEIEKEIKNQEEEDKYTSEIYRSVPGVGLLTARILANELGDLKTRFKNERELFSYTGLTPSEYSSGENIRKGKITRCGPARIRWILTEAAWMCIRKDIGLKKKYEKIKIRRGAKRAIVAIARTLIGRIRSCFVNSSLYQLNTK